MSGHPVQRPFIGVHMKCCRTYVRAYLNDAKDAYSGQCPRCGLTVRVEVVKQGGSSARFFEAG